MFDDTLRVGYVGYTEQLILWDHKPGIAKKNLFSMERQIFFHDFGVSPIVKVVQYDPHIHPSA